MKLSYMAINRTLEEGMAEDAGLRAANTRHGTPMLSEGRELSDLQLVEKLATCGISIDRTSFEQMARPSLSAQEMSDALAKNCNTRFHQESHGEDWLWIALCSLWERWLPERHSFEMIDHLAMGGSPVVNLFIQERDRQAARHHGGSNVRLPLAGRI